jgi:hypothetical protein
LNERERESERERENQGNEGMRRWVRKMIKWLCVATCEGVKYMRGRESVYGRGREEEGKGAKVFQE